MEEFGLHTIKEYNKVKVRRDTIAAYMVECSIFRDCMDSERKRGSVPRQWQWCGVWWALVGLLGEGKVRSPRISLSRWTVNLTGSVPVFGFWRGAWMPLPQRREREGFYLCKHWLI